MTEDEIIMKDHITRYCRYRAWALLSLYHGHLDDRSKRNILERMNTVYIHFVYGILHGG